MTDNRKKIQFTRNRVAWTKAAVMIPFLDLWVKKRDCLNWPNADLKPPSEVQCHVSDEMYAEISGYWYIKTID